MALYKWDSEIWELELDETLSTKTWNKWTQTSLVWILWELEFYKVSDDIKQIFDNHFKICWFICGKTLSWLDYGISIYKSKDENYVLNYRTEFMKWSGIYISIWQEDFLKLKNLINEIPKNIRGEEKLFLGKKDEILAIYQYIESINKRKFKNEEELLIWLWVIK